ncbi:hypothetical protein M733_10390 [Neisseria gonorrhoeae ATL_2011_05-13]|nr:hypothetical protein T556_10960 [Neisseria gonorrhoeae NG-k51.05]KLS08931.1 hypothetical protein M716_00360 [Neisseria gonorrhoeae SK32402]KLS27139.1 hypothetical protein M733_10390 [Neisseria gonorrhoeae ATL_2011_05-13]
MNQQLPHQLLHLMHYQWYFLRNHASYKQHQKLVEFHPKSKLA